MSIFDKVTVKSLKKNKMRTLVTIIGIMLSTALICAVTTSFASVRQYAINFLEYSNGKWHSHEADADYNTYSKLNDSDKIESVGVLTYIGYADIGSSNEYKPYLYISGLDEDEKGMIPVHLVTGRMPENKNEIIIPDHLSKNGEVKLKEGDKITLGIGDRKLDIGKLIKYGIITAAEADGYSPEMNDMLLTQNNPFRAKDDDEGNVLSAEYLDIREEREYTVVGIYKRLNLEDYSAPGYTAFTVPDAYNENTDYDVFYCMKNASDIYDFRKENGLSGENNTELLLFLGISRHNSFYSVIFGLMGIVVGLIMFGSIMLIYNAFAISVSERTKQFGLLSSIGATKKQLRRMVRFEATALSLIGIPLGILLGIAGMWVTFLSIGSRFSVFSDPDYPEPLRICISPAALAAAALIAFVTIRISAWIPSKRATKVSAVEAIRQNEDIKQKKHIKTPNLVFRLFGLPGVLAHKYFKRNKKKYRATIISLFMSIVLFVSASAFTNYLTGATVDAFDSASYDYMLYWHNQADDNLNEDDVLKVIRNTDHITEAAYMFRVYQTVYVPEDDINKKMLEEHSSLFEDSVSSQPVREGYKAIYMPVLFIDDGAYLDMLHKYGLSEDKFYNREAPLGVAFDDGMAWDEEKDKMIRFNIFNKDNVSMIYYAYDKIDGYPYLRNEDDIVIYYSSMDEKDIYINDCTTEAELNIGKVLYDRPYFIGMVDNPLVFPYSFREAMRIGNFEKEYGMEYLMLSDDTDKGYEALRNVMNENGIESQYFSNYAKNIEDDRNTVLIVKVFAYGFIVLISLIAAANVFNTITTNINLRRREFAMLRSVGMTAKGRKRMLNFECLLYGSKALLYGIPASAGVTYLIYHVVNRGVDTPFTMPWKAVAIAVLSVFLVVFVTMMYSMRKIKKDNTIDALKNENL